MLKLCQSLGFVNAICLDGGGSVWRRVNGKNDITTSRKVKNALLLYRKKKSGAVVEPEPTTPAPTPEPVVDNTKELQAQIEELMRSLSAVKTDLEIAQTQLKNKDEKIAEVEKKYENAKNDLATTQKNLQEVNSEKESLNNKIIQIKQIVQ